jgi:hypothetical protein
MAELLAGKKTHILVLGAIVINALSTVANSGPEAVMSADSALQTINLALVSTFKMGVDRVLGAAK